MRSANHDRAARALKRSLTSTSGCIPPERLGENLDAAEQAHVSACARCQAELSLFTEFNEATPDAQEGAAVQWIVSELKRRRTAPARLAVPGRSWAWLRQGGFLAAAATIVLGVAIGYLAWDPEPGVGRLDDRPQIYRSARVEAVAPVGDLRSAPRELEWRPVGGASRYDVVIREVDRAVLWQGSARVPRVTLPAGVVSQFAPGKTVLWEVTARNSSGEVIAESGTLRFRVVVSNSPRRD